MSYLSPAFDRQNPPLHPPPGCLNRLMWQLARRLFADHQPGPDGWCVICRPFQFYPCVGRQLADVGLVGAFVQPDAAPWRERPPANRGHRW
ncbi:MAG TPA: hypothetical protein VF657_05565 [Actinoplanes sp.]|jgi:hypothetical protein